MSDQPLWSDEERPWVNENLGENSKLGVAARLLSRWGQDWHKDFAALTYDYAHNGLADMADAITALLASNDAAEQRITALEAQLAQLRSGRWMPVTNDALPRSISMSDTEFGVMDDDGYWHYTDKPQTITICEWVEGEEVQPSQEVIETIEAALLVAKAMMMRPKRPEDIGKHEQRIAAATSWLAQFGGNDDTVR